MTKLIVVGVDGTETAQKAAASAAALAEALGADLHVVTAFTQERAEVLGIGKDQPAFSDEKYAESVAREAAEAVRSERLRVGHFAVHGSPAKALVQHAESHHAHMIVVGSRHMSGIGRVLGSVANSVAHNASCEVYIAKTD
ncbi:universal stress protein [Arthrobacter sp. 135MFCol5.1]|uniref:universal stress protein n=1 Tax=Arthrobacter sp. 135MFCol5.1 TaxID=1158050 RepID=UPI00036AE417|nr:universal stress protein [Arthrobacter sp. 135MFCol5.1]